MTKPMLEANLQLQLNQSALDAVLKPHRINLDLPLLGALREGQLRLHPQAGALEVQLSFAGGQGLKVLLHDQGFQAPSQTWTLRVGRLSLHGFVGAGLMGLAKPALLALALRQLDQRLPGLAQLNGDGLHLRLGVLLGQLAHWPAVVSALVPWGAAVGVLQVQTLECRQAQLSLQLHLTLQNPA